MVTDVAGLGSAAYDCVPDAHNTTPPLFTCACDVNYISICVNVVFRNAYGVVRSCTELLINPGVIKLNGHILSTRVFSHYGIATEYDHCQYRWYNRESPI